MIARATLYAITEGLSSHFRRVAPSKARKNAAAVKPCPCRGRTSRAIEKLLGFRYIPSGGPKVPIFEYKCRDCGAKFEKLVASSAGEVVCRDCASPRVEKLLSVFAVAGSSRLETSAEPGPCGACGAARRGMCQE